MTDSERKAPGRPLATLAGQRGFTMVEIMVAILVCSVGLMAVASSFDGFRRLMSTASNKQAATHVAEQEIERVRSLGWAKLGMTAEPGTSTDSRDPRYGVAGTSPNKTYRPSANVAAQKIVLDTVNGQVAPGPTPWQADNYKGQVYRFVTWGTDPSATCGTSCTGGAGGDYKRVTVAVTIETASGPRAAITASTIVVDPEAAPADATNGGSPNPPPVSLIGTTPTNYLWDTTAAPKSNPNDLRQPIAGSHATHATLTKPDLMGVTPPPSMDPAAPLYNYSTDVPGAFAGPGIVLKRSTTGCTGATSTTAHRWVTPELTENRAASGVASASIFTSTTSGVSVPATICLNVWDYMLNDDGTYAKGASALGSATYTNSQWPAAPTRLSFPFTYSTTSQNVSAGRRLGLELKVNASSGSDLQILYDHQNYSSWFQFETTGAGGKTK